MRHATKDWLIDRLKFEIEIEVEVVERLIGSSMNVEREHLSRYRTEETGHHQLFVQDDLEVVRVDVA